jgi:3-oxoacyl-[acyl-carrier protein] reductase
VAIVTGGSRGLGLAVASRLARDGFSLVLAGREQAALNDARRQVATEVCQAGQQVITQTTDVARPEEVAALVDTALGLTGRIDVLVCCAGVYGPMGRIEDVDWDDWAEAIAINLLGTVLCCRAVVPHMRRQASGKIVVLSGGGATQPLPGLSAYAASKAGVVRFAETLAREVQDAGIDVNAVAPGALNTRMLDQLLAAGPARVGEQFFASAVRQREQGGTPLETPAELIAFLASPASDGVTGRLLAAVWDDWRGLAEPARRAKLAETDVFTLRRIIPRDRGWAE